MGSLENQSGASLSLPSGARTCVVFMYYLNFYNKSSDSLHYSCRSEQTSTAPEEFLGFLALGL